MINAFKRKQYGLVVIGILIPIKRISCDRLQMRVLLFIENIIMHFIPRMHNNSRYYNFLAHYRSYTHTASRKLEIDLYKVILNLMLRSVSFAMCTIIHKLVISY